MAAAPDDDARRTLAQLEAKLRQLERELLRGHEPEPPEPESAPPTPFAPQPEAVAAPNAPEPVAPPQRETPTYEAGQSGGQAAEAEAEPEPEPEPEPVLDLDALGDAQGLLANLRTTIEALGVTAERVTTEARAVIDDHGRTLGRL